MKILTCSRHNQWWRITYLRRGSGRVMFMMVDASVARTKDEAMELARS